MRQIRLPLLLTCAALSPHPAHADRTYTVYKSNTFGQRSLLDEPEAVIEVDDLTGEAKVYAPKLFGEADTFKGPKYVIESDSVCGSQHHHSELSLLCDDSHHHWTGSGNDAEYEEE